MNRLDIFADLDHVHDDSLDSHHVPDKSVSIEFQFRLDVLFLFRLQRLDCGSNLLNNLKNFFRNFWFFKLIRF